MKQRRTRSVAFTLVEILVAMLIFGMLAALLFPVVSRARANARRVTCLSNLRQLGSAVVMYVQDADEVFPPVAQKEGTTTFWFDLLQTYLKNTAILECPDDATNSWKQYHRASYGYNAHLGGVAFPQFASDKLDSSHKSLVQVARPASTVLMSDSGTVPLAGAPADNWPAIIPCPPEIGDTAVLSSHTKEGALQNGALPAPRARHSGKANVLWVDGHASSLAVSAFYVAPGVIAPGETVPGYSPCLRPEKGCP